jgi:L-cysteate sulfo-lyase
MGDSPGIPTPAARGGPEPLRLAAWPTPLEPAPRLAVQLGLEPGDLWLKRDDLAGLGAGGNKIRKLQHTAAEALAEGADTLVTTGAAQSNHARATAAVAARLGLDCLLVLAGHDPGPATGNLLLDHLFGATVAWAGDVELAGLDAYAEELAAAGRDAGRRPYRVPYGGSGPVGARGYLDCAAELLAQGPEPACVVTAVGSGATMAGLVAGLGPGRVLGVDTGATPDPLERVAGMLMALLGEVPAGLRLRRDQVGGGYDQLTEGAAEAMTETARTEGVVLDPIYTGRAMAGLRAEVAGGGIRPGERTVFLHSGGLPGLLAHPEVARVLG